MTIAADVEIVIGKIRGPAFDMIIKPVKEGHIVSVIFPHQVESRPIPSHARKPKMLSGVWQLTTQPQHSTSNIKLIAVQSEVLPQDFKSVDSSEWRCWVKAVIQKTGAGFFEIECVAVVGDDNIRTREDLMKVLTQSPVVFGACLVPWIIEQCSRGNSLVA